MARHDVEASTGVLWVRLYLRSQLSQILRAEYQYLADDSLFNSYMLSDLKVKCGTETFHAHLNILSIRTTFFLDAVSSGFEESEQRTVTLRDTHPATVWGLLKWCYTGEICEDIPGKYLKGAGKVGRSKFPRDRKFLNGLLTF